MLVQYLLIIRTNYAVQTGATELCLTPNTTTLEPIKQFMLLNSHSISCKCISKYPVEMLYINDNKKSGMNNAFK